ncbi:hypothetical protein HK405_000408 [Cladochytrium tenue]|nr:hypothetical protein HK405_000408 [Cladochytrium tenue]
MTSTSASTAKALPAAPPPPPPPYSGSSPMPPQQIQVQNANNAYVVAPAYAPNPSLGNESTQLLIPISSEVARDILNSQDRSRRRRKRFLFFGIVLLVLYLIHRRRMHYYQGYPSEGIIPEYEFEQPVFCAAQTSTPVYPENRLITIPGDASKLALTVLGVGVGKIDLEVVDGLVGGIEVETHFHLTPDIPTDSVSVDYVYDKTTGHAEVIVNTPRCLPVGKCADDAFDAFLDSWNRCVAVASRVRVPRPPGNRSVPELRLSAQSMSIGARLHAPATDPVLVAGLSATTRSGSIAVSGPATIAGAADGRVRIATSSGSVHVTDVGVTHGVPLSAGTNSGSISLERLKADDLFAETTSGSITAKTNSGSVTVETLRGSFSSFNVTTTSGSIRVSDVSRGGAATSETALFLEARSGRISITNFDLGPDVTINAGAESGGVSVENAVLETLTASTGSGRISGENLSVGSALELTVRSGGIGVHGLSGSFQSVKANSYTGSVSLSNVVLSKSDSTAIHVKSDKGSARAELSGFSGHFEVRADRGSASVTGTDLHFRTHSRTVAVGDRGGQPTGPHQLTVVSGTGSASADLSGDS